MGCDKISNTCIESINARCVDYTGSTGANSTIVGGCVTQHEVTEELYSLTDKLILDTDVSGLSGSCLNYPLTENEITLKEVVSTQDQEICALKDKTKELTDELAAFKDISKLEFECLVDPCGDPITDIKTLLQLLINKSCNI